VTLAGLTVQKQAFMAMDHVGVAFNQMPIDGILGLPPKSHSNLGDGSGTPPFYWNLVSAGQLGSAVFSFLMNPSGGHLTLGGVDDSRHDGPIQYVELNKTIVNNLVPEWIIGVPEMSANGKPILNNPLAVALLDTGTSYILAPDEATAKALYAAVSPDIRQIDSKGAWGASCDVMKTLQPELNFVLADDKGNRFVLQSDKTAFNVGEYPGQPGICQAVVLHPVPAQQLPVPLWTIGSPALKAYYTVWDGTNLQVGFSTAKRDNGDEDHDGEGAGDGAGDAPHEDAATTTRPAALIVLLAAGITALVALF
jgi:hypothetical protein